MAISAGTSATGQLKDHVKDSKDKTKMRGCKEQNKVMKFTLDDT